MRASVLGIEWESEQPEDDVADGEVSTMAMLGRLRCRGRSAVAADRMQYADQVQRSTQPQSGDPRPLG